MVLPALLFVCLLLLYPMMSNVYLSFFSWSGLGKPVFIGIENYIHAFQDSNFLKSFSNTLIWVVYTLAVPVMGSLVIAVFLKNIKGGTVYKSIFFLPLTLSFVSTGIIWMNVFSSNNGVLNTILSLFTGGSKVKISWLASVPLNTISMLIAWTWQQLGISMVLFLMGLTTIPNDPLEAALIDGASKWQTFLHVTFPMLRPITTVVITQAIVNSFKTFDLIYVTTSGGPYRSSETLAVTMYRETFSMFNLGYGSAISVILSFIIIAISGWYVRKQMSRDMLHY
jgi:ABC-type sugar transport system permease subunit